MNKNLNNKYILLIIIFILLIVLSGSYYIGKISNSSEAQNNISTEKSVKDYINIGSYSVEEFKQKINEDYTLIDVRTPGEIKEGYIEGLDLKIDYYNNNFKSKIEKLDKTKKYLIYCRSGSRSGNTLYLMKNLGFKDVHDLKGGFGSWVRAGEKVVK